MYFIILGVVSHHAGSSRECHSVEKALCCSRMGIGGGEAALGACTTPIAGVLLPTAHSRPTAAWETNSPHRQLGSGHPCTHTQPLGANQPVTRASGYGAADCKRMLKYRYPLRARRRSRGCSLLPRCFPNRNKLATSDLKWIQSLQRRRCGHLDQSSDTSFDRHK